MSRHIKRDIQSASSNSSKATTVNNNRRVRYNDEDEINMEELVENSLRKVLGSDYASKFTEEDKALQAWFRENLSKIENMKTVEKKRDIAGPKEKEQYGDVICEKAEGVISRVSKELIHLRKVKPLITRRLISDPINGPRFKAIGRQLEKIASELSKFTKI